MTFDQARPLHKTMLDPSSCRCRVIPWIRRHLPSKCIIPGAGDMGGQNSSTKNCWSRLEGQCAQADVPIDSAHDAAAIAPTPSPGYQQSMPTPTGFDGDAVEYNWERWGADIAPCWVATAAEVKNGEGTCVQNEIFRGLVPLRKIDHCNFIFTRTNLSSNESRPHLH